MARKKNADAAPSAPAASDAPQKTGRFRQIWGVYKMARTYDPSITWWILLCIFGGIGVGVLVGQFILNPIYLGIVGFLSGLVGAMYLLVRRAETAAYSQIQGQPGAVSAAMGTIRRGWSVEDQPVAIDPRTQDMVFRAVGRPGVALVSEGPSHRVGKLLDAEEKRINRLLPNVPVLRFEVGDEPGQIKLQKIAMKIQRKAPKLSKQEAAEVQRRLKALGGVKMPLPKGVDPMRARPDRKGMRGR